MKITKELFSKKNNNIFLFSLENDKGMKIQISNYGGIITSWQVPEKNGNKVDIVLGFNTFEEYTSKKYIESCPYFGAIIGRYANRIGKGRFSIDGKEYKLAINNGENHLHGGIEGFDKKIWNHETIVNESEVCLSLSYLSIDGEENYPGNLQVKVDYTLNNKNELSVKYLAETDKNTTLNLTQHSYFNLKGEGNGDILEHRVSINADRYTKPDANLIPTGEMADLDKDTLDLRTEKSINENIKKVGGNGYDHNYILNKRVGELSFAAKVREPESNRILEVYTTKPGIQFYTGNFLDNTIAGKSGKAYFPHAGFCLETQFFPDSPNNSIFPSAILKAGEKYEHETIFKLLL